jgi:hypothetical protein
MIVDPDRPTGSGTHRHAPVHAMLAKRALARTVRGLLLLWSMSNLRDGSRLVFLLAMAVPGAACSTNNRAGAPDAQPTQVVSGPDDAQAPDVQFPEDAEVPDAGPTDATPDASNPDASNPDAGSAIWRADSTGFELTVSGGGFFDGSNCSARTWHYDAASRALTRKGCSPALDAAVVLTPASASELAARLSALQAKGSSGICYADAAIIGLTVLGPGTAQSRYGSDIYSDCPSLVDAGIIAAGITLFVSNGALEDLDTDLAGYAAVCRADGGAPGDAGAACVTEIGDAGPDGAPG